MKNVDEMGMVDYGVGGVGRDSSGVGGILLPQAVYWSDSIPGWDDLVGGVPKWPRPGRPIIGDYGVLRLKVVAAARYFRYPSASIFSHRAVWPFPPEVFREEPSANGREKAEKCGSTRPTG